jgi:DNA-binding LacI/PurR family transcriptional regulator
VGVVLGERLGYAFSDPMTVSVLDGLAEEVGATGSSLLLVPVRPGGAAGTADRLATLPMDGAVLLDGEPAGSVALGVLRARGTPLVGIDGPRGAGVPLVRVDDEGATTDLVTVLTHLGHRRFGLVALPQGTAEGGAVPMRRTRAARRALATVPGVRLEIAAVDVNVVDEGEQAAGRLLDGPLRPTALVAQSDVLALGCLRAAAARGLAVPGDVSVVGFDGIDLPLVDGTVLTTVRQPAADKGRTAARLLAAVVAGEHPQDVELPIELRPGTTTGPCPDASPQASATTA